jgi:hypothetical protein
MHPDSRSAMAASRYAVIVRMDSIFYRFWMFVGLNELVREESWGSKAAKSSAIRVRGS